jgi:excisionase family DNA binding protein
MMAAAAERPRVDLSTRLLTKEEVAELLCVKPSTVADLARRKGDPLPSVKVGRSRRYVLAEVEAWLTENGR